MRCLLAVTALLLHREVRLEERRTLAVIRYIAQGFAHAVAQDHSAGDVGNARKIVCSAGRHLIEYDMLSGAPPPKAPPFFAQARHGSSDSGPLSAAEWCSRAHLCRAG